MIVSSDLIEKVWINRGTRDLVSFLHLSWHEWSVCCVHTLAWSALVQLRQDVLATVEIRASFIYIQIVSSCTDWTNATKSVWHYLIIGLQPRSLTWLSMVQMPLMLRMNIRVSWLSEYWRQIVVIRDIYLWSFILLNLGCLSVASLNHSVFKVAPRILILFIAVWLKVLLEVIKVVIVWEITNTHLLICIIIILLLILFLDLFIFLIFLFLKAPFLLCLF